MFKRRERKVAAAQDWWFASIAIPLLAATIGPFANVLSIAALVSYWREDLSKGPGQPLLGDLQGISFKDPRWATGINAASLVTGYVGNFFLFANFTQRIPYLIALPMTIILWFFSAFLLVGILIAMALVCPPVPPLQTYTQAFWYGVIAAVLYWFCAVGLLVNMLGYYLGHYEHHFNLTDAQRTLILQTFLFFLWLAGGAGVYTALEPWNFSAALYFCNVTILTIGFGDLTPSNSAGRGLVIPYALGGIVFLGLMISSISNFVSELGHAKIIRARFEKQRVRTLERSNTVDLERQFRSSMAPSSMARSSLARSSIGNAAPGGDTALHFHLPHGPRRRPERPKDRIRRLSLIALREEKDRFNAMRRIQDGTARFKKYTTLTASIIAFISLWLVGAIVFWQVEKTTSSEINGFYDAFYFCYVSLVTVGYGDLVPTSSAGRSFFTVWSLLAVPSVTILISAAGNTVVDAFNRQTNRLAEFTLLPQQGVWREAVDQYPWLKKQLQSRAERKAERKRLQQGFDVGPDPESEQEKFGTPTLEQLAAEEDKPPTEHEMAKRLALAIRHMADDMRHETAKKYSYEEWAEFTELIRFTSNLSDEDDEEEEGLIKWDWIGEDSPMMANQTESEWLLDRLCESMARYIKHQAPSVPRVSVDVPNDKLTESSSDGGGPPDGGREVQGQFLTPDWTTRMTRTMSAGNDKELAP